MQTVDVGNPDVVREELESLRAFSLHMLRKMQENRHKGGWKGDLPRRLLARLREEVEELEGAVSRWEAAPGIERTEEVAVLAEQVAREAADVANFSLFVADVCGGLAKARRV